MMEDKLLKFLYKEGSNEDIIALEKEIKETPELAASVKSIEAVDKMFKQSNSYNLKMDASFETKLSEVMKTQMSNAKPLIELSEKSNYLSYFNYAAAITFAICSIAYIFIKGGFKIEWNEGIIELPTTTLLTIFFTSFCLLFFYFFDRFLSEGNKNGNVIPCI